MSAEIQHRLIVLWEHELRLAARLLDDFWRAARAAKDGERGEAQRDATTRLLEDAVRACRVALLGAEDEVAHIVVSSRSAETRERMPCMGLDRAGIINLLRGLAIAASPRLLRWVELVRAGRSVGAAAVGAGYGRATGWRVARRILRRAAGMV